MSVIDEVKQKTDIIEVIGQSVPLTKAGRNFRALCPFHSETAPSFYVFPERQSWHCFGACNTGGDVFSFVMKQQNLEFGEALRLLAEQAGVTIPTRVAPDARKDERERLYQINAAAVTYFHEQLLNSPDAARARDYLLRRGFTSETIASFQLGYGPNSWEALKQQLTGTGYGEKELLDGGLLVENDDGTTRDRFRNRPIFPIRDSRSHITGFGARVLDDSLPKYTNSPRTLVFDKSGTLYAIDLAAPSIRKQDRTVLVEGYMDVITAHQNGFTNVLASMGTSITERQVTTLKKLSRNITLAMDADAAGKEAMRRCVDYENTLDAEVQVMLLPNGRDPDDVIRENPATWQDIVEHAVPVLDYAFDMAAAGLDFTRARDKSQVTDELLPLVARIKDDIRRDHYLTKLAVLTGIRYNILETTMRDRVVKSEPRKATRKFDTKPITPILSSPVEEQCLSLLLQHPELKDHSEGLLPEYFQNSQNREIFVTWKQSADLESLKESLDPAMWEQVDSLVSQKLFTDKLEKRMPAYILRLKEDFFRELKTKEMESNADLARLQEQGLDSNTRLLEIFNQKARTNRSARDGSGTKD